MKFMKSAGLRAVSLSAIGLGTVLVVAIYFAQPLLTSATAQNAPQDNIIDGTLYPKGYTPMEIKDGVYPRVYAPNTEKLGPKDRHAQRHYREPEGVGLVRGAGER